MLCKFITSISSAEYYCLLKDKQVDCFTNKGDVYIIVFALLGNCEIFGILRCKYSWC